MHSFSELVGRATCFTLSALNDAYANIVEDLNNSASTRSVKNLQTVVLQKAIFAVGMYSIFEAILQDRLEARNGFIEARNILTEQGEHSLNDRFEKYCLAINVLKHGRGPSYDKLLGCEVLPFRLKRPNETFFLEGDVSEVSTLVQVEDAFVMECAQVIEDVSQVIRRAQPDCSI